MKSLFLSVNDTLYRSCIWIAGLSILAMTLIIPWGIFARYVLGTGSSWPEPVSILLMVVFTFVGAAASYRAGAHMAVGMITDRLPPLQRQLVALLVVIGRPLLSEDLVGLGPGESAEQQAEQRKGQLRRLHRGTGLAAVPERQRIVPQA